MIENQEFLQNLLNLSSTMNDTVKYLIGMSILALVSTNYRRPKLLWARMIYILLLPAWVALGFAFYYGDSVIRWCSGHYPEGAIKQVVVSANEQFGQQQFAFRASCALIFLWLVLYLFLWIFSDQLSTTES